MYHEKVTFSQLLFIVSTTVTVQFQYSVTHTELISYLWTGMLAKIIDPKNSQQYL